MEIHIVTNRETPEFKLLQRTLSISSVIALDAEWKPTRGPTAGSFPTVSLLQIACRMNRGYGDNSRCLVFLVDLVVLPLDHVWELIRDVFLDLNVLKLGFRFKQDLVFLSSTFAATGSLPGFALVEPFLDITSVYYYIKSNNTGKKLPKQSKSLATICEEILGVSLSKELQCSDWSCRPLTKEQIHYAAADAYYLLEIFDVFQQKCSTQGDLSTPTEESIITIANVGLKEVLKVSHPSDCILRTRFCKASDMVKASAVKLISRTNYSFEPTLNRNIVSDNKCITILVRKYGEKLVLKESDRKPKNSKRKGKRQSSGYTRCKEQIAFDGDWQGPPPWDPCLDGDGHPKFLCDVMVEGLARHLRCVGIDAAIPSNKKPDPRQLLDQAYKEKRVLLTRDAKLLKLQYLARNQVYRVKNLLKNDQLLEVVETFGLKISEEQLMTRCTKCNGSFIQKPLSMEEAIAASKGFQVIPQCLFNRDLEFWQCRDCKQLYWEGTQYQNAVQKFVTICKLNDE